MYFWVIIAGEIEKETEQIENQALSMAEPVTSTPVLEPAADLAVADLNPAELAQDARPVSEPVNIEQFKEDFVELNYGKLVISVWICSILIFFFFLE